MNLNKLRIMQQIQIALTEKGIPADILVFDNLESSLEVFIDNANCHLDSVGCRATEAELQLWHDTIVYGPQASLNSTAFINCTAISDMTLGYTVSKDD